MAGPNYVLDKGFEAGGAIGRFRCVELGANEVVTQANAVNDPVIGICQDEITSADATNGRVADIRMAGISRCIASGTIAAGDRVRAAADGGVVTLAAGTAGQRQVGIALQSAVSGDHLDVFLTIGATADVA